MVGPVAVIVAGGTGYNEIFIGADVLEQPVELVTTTLYFPAVDA
ncbi:MAG: hypothetical protein BWY67_02303 [Bacteroidetes bacterium ADurb.Bin397]|nr:MAG: hypothetical protein BWY67_02303 [Bacteroidetes bacterium ADurb.Bin397]